jgi:hypothetical protein
MPAACASQQHAPLERLDANREMVHAANAVASILGAQQFPDVLDEDVGEAGEGLWAGGHASRRS